MHHVSVHIYNRKMREDTHRDTEKKMEHGKHGRNEIRTLRCLGLSRKLFAKAHQAKASNDDDQKICSRKLITHLAVLELTIITNLRNL